MALAVADGRFKNGLMLWQFYGKERQIRMHWKDPSWPGKGINGAVVHTRSPGAGASSGLTGLLPSNGVRWLWAALVQIDREASDSTWRHMSLRLYLMNRPDVLYHSITVLCQSWFVWSHGFVGQLTCREAGSMYSRLKCA
jgi:hypothetical protein